MGYSRRHRNLWCNRLDKESRDRTCGYWFTVTTETITAHTAHRTRKDLNRWLYDLGLKLATELNSRGGCPIIGEYTETMLMEPATEFAKREGRRIRWMSNGEYTTAILTNLPDGSVEVFYLNPNIRDRDKWDYRETEKMLDRDWVEDEAAAMAV